MMNQYEDEIWAQIQGYPNYEISNFGRVWNSKYSRELKPRLDSDGYARVSLCLNGKPHDKKIHRLVAQTFLPSTLDAIEVNHDDGDKSYNYIENLEWMTHKENVNHAFRNGLNSSGRKKAVRIIETGEVFTSLTECALSINGFPGSIHNCLSGKSKTSRGYTFEYVN